MSDSPRTDAAQYDPFPSEEDGEHGLVVQASLSKQLERELAAANSEIAELKKAALSDIGQIYGLLQEGEYDKADDYCRCAAERYAP